MASPRVRKPEFVQRVIHLCEIARGTGDDCIFDAVVAASGMRHDVVILCPHGLKCRVLAQVRPLPPQCCRIEFPKEDANHFSDNGDATKSAVESITPMELDQFRAIRHSLRGTLTLVQYRRRVGQCPRLDVRASLPPKRLSPCSNLIHVGYMYKVLSQL
jgi:hypothetical protein